MQTKILLFYPAMDHPRHFVCINSSTNGNAVSKGTTLILVLHENDTFGPLHYPIPVGTGIFKQCLFYISCQRCLNLII